MRRPAWLGGEILVWVALIVLVNWVLWGCDVEATVGRGVQPKTGAGGSCIFSGGSLAALQCTDDGWCMICRNGTENGPHLICHWLNAYRNCR